MSARPPVPFLKLPGRNSKPRQVGLTSIIDSGFSLAALGGVLEDQAHLFDMAKLINGTGAITPRLNEKVALYRKYGIPVYCGGTLFEKALSQDRLSPFVDFLKAHAIDWIEISDGVVPSPLAQRLDIVRDLAPQFTVLAEVGSKDQNVVMPAQHWLHEIEAFLKAGASYVVLEGRESGTAGIYRQDGQVRGELAEEMLDAFGPERLIFEAPSAKAQMYFINLAGPNVNLGNVMCSDVLMLESQRLGLRSETFNLDQRYAP